MFHVFGDITNENRKSCNFHSFWPNFVVGLVCGYIIIFRWANKNVGVGTFSVKSLPPPPPP